ncbi:MAG: polysaccharide biosynthesis protein [Fischerella sp. CENA71]|nr:polysaccharide biosynthesis protein [Fischerella sp. CENA71]
MKPKFDSLVVHGTNKAEIIRSIQQLVPPGSATPEDPTVLATLQTLTAELIQAYMAEGKLQADPFANVHERRIHLYQAEVKKQLQGKVVLVTGGEGCVGSHLVKKLIELGTRHVVSVDKARCSNSLELKPIGKHTASLTLYAADVRNYDALTHIFGIEKPDIVFHLAAQRLPWLAEIQIRETVTTSIFGTQNIIQLCESFGVQQCIFSSTGKASRYFTTEVYAASKKFCEWQFAQAASEGKVTYGMVRFTHMLENSSFCQQIDDKIQQNKIVNVHAPERYVTAQNVSEAIHLLLNAIVLSQPGSLRFLTVRNLGWPTETLEVALYKIIQSGKQLPIYFQGLIPGYKEHFFLGHLNCSKPTEINLLANVLEPQFIDGYGDMFIGEIAPFSPQLLAKYLAVLQTLIDVPFLPEIQIKQCLGKGVGEIASSIFSQASPQTLLKILKWGVNLKSLSAEEISIHVYRDILELLVQGLYGRLNKEILIHAQMTPNKFDELIEILANLSSIPEEIAYLQAVSRNVRDFDGIKSSINAPYLLTNTNNGVILPNT